SAVPDPQSLDLALTVNGETRQAGTTAHMIFSVAQIVAYCSRVFTLEPGDLLYTGTPEGVGQVHAGDVLEATATGLAPLRVTINEVQ
ncbi:MAG: fumarylacetoacetate hydrolase family protein, partial [Bacteroidota bacterium]